MQSLYVLLPLAILSYFTLVITECKETRTQYASNRQLLNQQKSEAQQTGDVCPLWFFYNSSTNQCEYYNSIPRFNGPDHTFPNAIKCDEQRVLISYNYYMTYLNGELFFSYAVYFNPDGYNKPVSGPNFIELPSNISELNDYMCGPANRKGFLCSECIDGFGPSATSPKFKCSNCTTGYARYNVAFYLLSEILPILILYFVILIFQINVTSAPMVSFILFSQAVFISANYNVENPDQVKYFLPKLSIIYGIWNLDFFRNAIPPLCISENLKVFHIFYLQNISTVFPFILICLTWISIELYSRDFRIFVWPWRALNMLLPKRVRVFQNKNTNRTVIDAFATFFLLSYTKLVIVTLIPIYPTAVYHINVTTHTSTVVYRQALNPTVNFLSKRHILEVTVSIIVFLTVVLLPVLLLALYPVRAFRALLFKFCRRMASVNFFVEKFYSCYRDGLDGGRDMRSLASLYFLIIPISFVLWIIFTSYYALAIVFLACSFLNLIVQPYKERYMAITDAVLFANHAILVYTIDELKFNSYYGHHYFYYDVIAGILITFPSLWLVGFITFKLLKPRIKACLMKDKLPCCNFLRHRNEDNEVECVQQVENIDNNLPDRILRPEQYVQWGYDSIS